MKTTTITAAWLRTVGLRPVDDQEHVRPGDRVEVIGSYPYRTIGVLRAAHPDRGTVDVEWPTY